MTLIGMLHNRKSPEKLKRAYACAAVAKMDGADFCYFSYRGVDLHAKIINGWVHENGSWIKTKLNYPDVIINVSSPETPFQKRVYKQLKQLIPFTRQAIGNKIEVYHKLFEDGKFNEYLIPTYPLISEADLLAYTEHTSSVVVKPVDGKYGKKVLFITKTPESSFVIKSGPKTDILNLEPFRLFISRLASEKNYLYQPYIECKTKYGLAYDIRIHVQKNGQGEWEVNLIYPRVSGNGQLVSNIGSGGYRGELEPFLQEQFTENHLHLKQRLESLAMNFPKYMDELYKKSFDELGIDLGIDAALKFWLFEVNTRPGARHRELDTAIRLVKYAKFLAEHNDEAS
ncbi:YheC/YheD family endospore coat-associated protein [Neobacillus dielmonensis]|uniref:YheC/YheD family endospore coat-associated protein n=1 Tax=Neobacillus dielmonensis TaxID=1347369 RepID=UPI0005A6572B|nr:YheC/YheD family protein [Neobacillus dielmonensis]